MKAPVADNRHVKEYLMYGALAAILYLLPVLYLLFQNKYQNLYLLFIGNALFMAAIFFYEFHLINHPYDGKRAVSMLMAGLLATATGVVIASLAVTVLMFVFFPHIAAARPAADVLSQANTGSSTQQPSGFLFMILLDLVLGNVSVGVFASIITSYVNKRNQTKDKPADIENRVPVRNR